MLVSYTISKPERHGQAEGKPAVPDETRVDHDEKRAGCSQQRVADLAIASSKELGIADILNVGVGQPFALQFGIEDVAILSDHSPESGTHRGPRHQHC